MRNRTVTLALLIIILGIFFIYYIVLNVLIASATPENELEKIIAYAQENKWEEAEASRQQLVESWDGVKYLLAINYSEADYSMFVDNLSRLQGAIITKDDTETINQALATRKLWDNFIKIVPQP